MWLRRGPLPGVAGAVLGAALAAAGALLLAGAGTRVEVAGNVLVTPNGPESLPESLIAESNSPSIARNPTRHGNLAVSDRLDRYRQTYSAALHWSDDDGASWHHTSLPLPAGRDRPFAPDLAFAPDGTLYVIYVNLAGIGNDPQTLWVSRSLDGGRTLAPPSPVTGRYAFQARLAIDGRGTLLVTWLQGEQVGNLSLTGPPSPIVMSRSDDGGRTFSPPVQVSDPGRRRVGAASAVADPAGGVDVLYEDFRNDVRDFENLEGPPWDQPFALVLSRSTDGGRTFPPGVELESDVIPGERFLVYLPVFPSLAAAPDGALYVSWADARNGDDDVFLRRSSDHGASWSAAVRVNDNRQGDGTRQWLPRIAVAPDGRVDVAFLDRRSDPHDIMTDAHLATSGDGGRSFHDAHVSSQPFDSRVGSSAAPYLAPDLGSRLGLVSDGSGAEMAWTDTRLGSLDTGRQDIMSARVSITHRSPVWPALLLAAGMALAALSLVRLRSLGQGGTGRRG